MMPAEQEKRVTKAPEVAERFLKFSQQLKQLNFIFWSLQVLKNSLPPQRSEWWNCCFSFQCHHKEVDKEPDVTTYLFNVQFSKSDPILQQVLLNFPSKSMVSMTAATGLDSSPFLRVYCHHQQQCPSPAFSGPHCPSLSLMLALELAWSRRSHSSLGTSHGSYPSKRRGVGFLQNHQEHRQSLQCK